VVVIHGFSCKVSLVMQGFAGYAGFPRWLRRISALVMHGFQGGYKGFTGCLNKVSKLAFLQGVSAVV
jgi:hypothetical protein